MQGWESQGRKGGAGGGEGVEGDNKIEIRDLNTQSVIYFSYIHTLCKWNESKENPPQGQNGTLKMIGTLKLIFILIVFHCVRDERGNFNRH